MKEISWTGCLRLGVTAAAVYLLCAGGESLAALADALMPLLLGGGLACVVDVPMSALERRLFPRGGRLGRLVCLALSLAGVLLTLAWLAGAILPQALQCLTLLTARLPGLLTGLLKGLQGMEISAALTAVLPDWQDLAQHGLQLAVEEAFSWVSLAADALTALTAGVMNVLLALVLAVYLLEGKERLALQLTRLTRRTLGEEALQRATAVVHALRDAFGAYVTGQCLEALVLGCLCLIGMLLLRLPGALPISAMAGLTALLPLIGPPLAALMGAVLLLPEGFSAAMTFAVFFLALQQAESWLIGPRVVGGSTGLSPVWTLLAMLMGGGLLGVAGAMLAVPVAAAARALLMEEKI